MFDRIRNSLAGGRQGACGRAGKPAGLSAMTTLLVVVLALFSLTLMPERAVAGKKSAPTGEDAVTAFLLKETGSPDFLKVKNIDKPISPASLTKIMTCMIAIESGRMDEVVTIPLEATQVEPTKAGFGPGDRFRLRDLVEAAMVNSSNDAAFAIAIHLGGSMKSFVSTMNARARALGMTNTVFTNPAGYDRGLYDGNLSTARDLMKLTEHAIRYHEFNDIARLDRVVFSELNTGRHYYLRAHNKLLDRYPYSVGIKTGYTSKAGPCLIARAVRDGKDMLVIMLQARTDRWGLASSMFEEGFSPFASSGKPVHSPASPPEKRVAADVAPARSRTEAVAGPVVKRTAPVVSSAKKSAAAGPKRVQGSSVYARRAQALESLRLKVAEQAEEREAARKEAAKDRDDQAANRQRQEMNWREVSLFRYPVPVQNS